MAEQIPAGPELDRMVEEVVFKRVPCPYWRDVSLGVAGRQWYQTEQCRHEGGTCFWETECPAYSTNRSAAALVFFRAIESHGHAAIHGDMEDYGREPGNIVTVVVGLEEVVCVTGPFCETICRAALAAEKVLR